MIDIEGLQNLCSCLATMALELMTAMTQDLGSHSLVPKNRPVKSLLKTSLGHLRSSQTWILMGASQQR